MKRLIIFVFTIFSISTFYAQTVHTVKVAGLYQYDSYYVYESYGGSVDYDYQLSNRYTLNVKMGYTRGRYLATVRSNSFSGVFWEFQNYETAKFLEFGLYYSLYPDFIPKNRMNLGLGGVWMNLEFDYLEDYLIQNRKLVYYNRDILSVNSMLYAFTFLDEFEINTHWSVYGSASFRGGLETFPGFHSFDTVGEEFTPYSFIFSLGLGYSF